jgi:trehalose 6-phosphate phosphatase
VVPGADLLAELASAPERAAILLDVDGVLAPIVPRPEDASVPAETRWELRRLHGRYALVACVSGRPSEDARRVVGVDELVYVGEHGLELEPEAEAWAGRLADFAEATREWPVERKRLTLSYHWRTAPDEDEAVATLERIARSARDAGLVPRWGRKVLELRPPLAANKGTAVRLLLERAGLRRAFYAGDDTTDLDAFRALDGLELAVRIAVVSTEGPDELPEAADLVVDGPRGMLELLRRL